MRKKEKETGVHFEDHVLYVEEVRLLPLVLLLGWRAAIRTSFVRARLQEIVM